MVFGYIFRVRMASFFAGAAAASAYGFYVLHKDYQAGHQALSKQALELFGSLETRISELEKLNQTAVPVPSIEQPSSD